MKAHVIFQLAAAATVALALWLMPLLANAAPRSCPYGYPMRIAHGCRSVAGNGVACDAGYQGQFTRVNGKFVGRCVAGPIAWGG